MTDLYITESYEFYEKRYMTYSAKFTYIGFTFPGVGFQIFSTLEKGVGTTSTLKSIINIFLEFPSNDPWFLPSFIA